MKKEIKKVVMYHLFNEREVKISYSVDAVRSHFEESLKYISGVELISMLLEDGENEVEDLSRLLNGDDTVTRNGLVIERNDISARKREFIVVAEDGNEKDICATVCIKPCVKMVRCDNLLNNLIAPKKLYNFVMDMFFEEYFDKAVENAELCEVVNEDMSSLFDCERESVELHDPKRDLFYDCLLTVTSGNESIHVTLEGNYDNRMKMDFEQATFIKVGKLAKPLFDNAVERLKAGQELDFDQDCCMSVRFKHKDYRNIVMVYAFDVDPDEYIHLGNF